MNEARKDGHDECFWQAFLYVSGDMTEAESQQFELLLLEDERLCEAVAQAVQITAAVARKDGASVSRRHDSPSPALARLPVDRGSRHMTAGRKYSGVAALAAVAMCACVMWAISGFEAPGTPEAAAVVETSDSDAKWIVSVWADESAMASSGLDEPEGALDEDLDVPDWLVTAVSISDTDAEFIESDDMNL